MPSILAEIDQVVMAALRTDHHDEVIAAGAERLNRKFPERFTVNQWTTLLTARLEHDYNRQGR